MLQRLTFGRGMKDPERVIENMRVNCARDLPWFMELPRHHGIGVAVAGGPSLKTRLGAVRKRKKDGECIVALNGTAALLRQNGIEPDIIAFCDPSDKVLGFIGDETDQCLYLVASGCHPSVIDKLAGRNVMLWHMDIPLADNGADKVLDEYPHRPSSLIGGGSTIGLRIMNLFFLMGFRTWHHYGLDSSYADDGSDHAYTKHDGPELESMEVMVNGKRYRVSPWMARQAEEFKEFYAQFRNHGCRITVHGEGLIPDMWRIMRKLERQAA